MQKHNHVELQVEQQYQQHLQMSTTNEKVKKAQCMECGWLPPSFSLADQTLSESLACETTPALSDWSEYTPESQHHSERPRCSFITWHSDWWCARYGYSSCINQTAFITTELLFKKRNILIGKSTRARKPYAIQAQCIPHAGLQVRAIADRIKWNDKEVEGNKLFIELQLQSQLLLLS